MRSSNVLFTVVFLSSVLAAEASLLVGAVTAIAIGGLATLKGAAVIERRRRRSQSNRRPRIHHHYPYYHMYRKRSIQNLDNLEETENLLLATASQLDTQGCVLKLLCQLQTKEEIQRTFEENILADMFSNNTEVLTSYNADFVYASEVGSYSRSSATCDLAFPQCPLDEAQLLSILQKAWGCGPSFSDEEDETQTEEVTEESI